MGKGKDSNQEATEHEATSLSALKDPASFGPPPKRTLHTASSPGSLGVSVRTHTGPRRQGLEEGEGRPSQGSYKADTTSLSTAQLPEPPVRGTVKPQLPPRLPPRQDFHLNTHASTPPPTYIEGTKESTQAQSYLNQGALDRLGKSGITVPDFGIGRIASPPVPSPRNALPPDPPSHPVPAASHEPQISGLQSRFAKSLANASHGEPSSTATDDSGQRREQAAAGLGAASALGQKYGATNTVNRAVSVMNPPAKSPKHSSIAKKPPPPPPPKKKQLAATIIEPPPVPLGSKPKF